MKGRAGVTEVFYVLFDFGYGVRVFGGQNWSVGRTDYSQSKKMDRETAKAVVQWYQEMMPTCKIRVVDQEEMDRLRIGELLAR